MKPFYLKALKQCFCLVFFLGGSIVYSQTNDSIYFSKKARFTKDSENIFENFGRLGIKIGVQDLEWFNQINPNFGYRYDSDPAPIIGLDYNFYQTGRFNFRAGVFARRFNTVVEYNVLGSEIGTTFVSEFKFVGDAEYSFHVPITFEYNKFLARDFAISIFAGVEIMYFDSRNLNTNEFSLVSGIGSATIRRNYFENQDKFYTGAFIGVGTYFRVGSVLLRADVKWYNRLPEDNIISEAAIIEGLVNSPDTGTVHSFQGNYWSLNLTLHPKNWFKKKK